VKLSNPSSQACRDVKGSASEQFFRRGPDIGAEDVMSWLMSTNTEPQMGGPIFRHPEGCTAIY
jgi:hypothetical protein